MPPHVVARATCYVDTFVYAASCAGMPSHVTVRNASRAGMLSNVAMRTARWAAMLRHYAVLPALQACYCMLQCAVPEQARFRMSQSRQLC